VRKFHSIAALCGNGLRPELYIDAQSTRLHRDGPQSRFHRVPGTGHVIHQIATGVVMSAINEVAEDR
jgi:pimeloyl-ACP methyl ester carboxylesterase